MNQAAQSCAFVRIGDFSNTNDHVLEHLRCQFPELDADVIDLSDFGIVSKPDAARLYFLWCENTEYPVVQPGADFIRVCFGRNILSRKFAVCCCPASR